MRHILRRRELAADVWQPLAALDPASAARAAAGSGADVPHVLVTLGQWSADPARFEAWRGPLGVRLAPADAVETLAALVPRLELVAIEFPAVGEGRGYSQGRLLRERLGYHGELRAVGAGVGRDQLFLLARCGFDAFEVPEGEDAGALRAALQRYDVAYQAGAAAVALRRQRHAAPGA